MNFTVSFVGGPCCGKSTLMAFMQSKFAGRIIADIAYVLDQNGPADKMTIMRNEALHNQNFMFNYLTHLFQSRMRAFSEAFKKLGPRGFLFFEQSVEFVDLLVMAARKAKLITEKQWRYLRTLGDELASYSIVDMFVVFEVDDYETCTNNHKKPNAVSSHRSNEVLVSWVKALGDLLPDWVREQKARSKVVFEVSSRLSPYVRISKSKQILNVVFEASNRKMGTGFAQLPVAETSLSAGARAVRSWLKASSASVRFNLPSEDTVNMPPKGSKKEAKKSDSASPTLLQALGSEETAAKCK